MRNKRFQNRITTGALTLPVAILLSVFCWILSAILLPDIEVESSSYPLWATYCNLSIPAWGNSILSFFIYSIIGYFLIELNNAFGIIRMRASMQTAAYFLLIAICPNIQTLYLGDVASVAFLIALFFLFKSYQQPNATGSLFYSFVFIGVGSLIFPQLMLFAPIFWIGAFSFRALCLKSFFASLIGWSLPYWLLLGHAYVHGQMDIFYQPFLELITFQPIRFDFSIWELTSIGYLLILYLVSSIHCLVMGYEDKIRTRSYLHFLIFMTFCIFIYIGLQPNLSVQLLPLLLIGISFLAGHLFVLTNSRTSNIFFIFMFIGLFLIYGFNIWMLL